MTRSEWAARGRRGLRGGLATAGIAAVLLAATPAASASAAPRSGSGVMIESGAFPGYVLCASANDESVWLKPKDSTNAYCLWKRLGPATEFSLYNVAKDQYMSYTGGNEGAVVMEDQDTSPLGPNGQLWSWGGQEDWGAAALQSFWDSGQNVDAKSPDGWNIPRTDPVHTRGWRHGFQRELTWNADRVG